MNCPFCKIELKAELSNEKAFAIFDTSPVSEGHMLIIPRRHGNSFFETTEEERTYVLDLLDKAKTFLDQRFQPDGFNIGVNIDFAAGQTIDHLHIHLIPRYEGDTNDPTGGVRGVIPARQHY